MINSLTVAAFRPRHASSTIDAIINEACKVKVVLPNVLLLRESLRKAGNWSEQVDRIQVIDGTQLC